MKEKYLSDIDEFLRSDHGTAFDRTHFSRRKTGERRVNCCEATAPGHVVRSGRDRRVLPDRRRSWKRGSGDRIDVASWES